MNRSKPRMRYDSPNGVWICEGYYAETPLEAWSMWEQQRRIRVITLESNQKLLEELCKGDHSTRREDAVAVIGVDLGSPDQPDYTSTDLSMLDNCSATKEDLRGLCSRVGLHYPDHLNIPVAIRCYLKKVISKMVGGENGKT